MGKFVIGICLGHMTNSITEIEVIDWELTDYADAFEQQKLRVEQRRTERVRRLSYFYRAYTCLHHGHAQRLRTAPTLD